MFRGDCGIMGGVLSGGKSLRVSGCVLSFVISLASAGVVLAEDIAGVAVGQNVSSLHLTDRRCGLPLSAISEVERRVWYNEASKGGQIGPFQDDETARGEILSISTPPGYGSVCEAVEAQLQAFLPSLNQAVESSNALHNGDGVGLRCGAGGASGATACAATTMVYAIKTVSFMCHEVCDAEQ